MLNGLVRLTACVASGAAFLALTGCGGGQPDDGYAGPPPSGYERGGSAPVLMGQTPAARPADDSGLLGGPDGYGRMAPIPNPADLTKAERVRFYGHKYDHLPEPKGRKAGSPAHPSYQLIQRRRADGTLEVSMRPIANPEDMSAAERRRVYGARYAPRPAVVASPRRLWQPAPKATPVARPVAKPAPAPRPAVAAVKPAPKPAAVAPAPKPVVAAPAPKPVAPLAKAPVAPAVAPKPVLTPAQQLSAAVRPEAMKGAVLTVPEGLAKGEESKVSLSLPGDLLAIIKREAAKLGLGKAARKAEVTATLTGDGYEITPNGAQTQKLKAGEAATFDWNVKPGAGPKAPLKATVDGTLTGDRKAKTTFSLATLEQAVAPAVEEVKAAAKGFKFPKLSLKSLAIPGMKPVDVPGVGTVGSEKLVGAGLALLALILVIAMARNASANRARAERRRKFRTMADYGSHEAETETVSQPYVNPMIAAAGGAVAGAAVMHAADSHGHAEPEAHAHHEAPAPAHDDHAPVEQPAADDHAHDAHPVSHHPEPEAHAEPVAAAADDHAPAADSHAHDHHAHPAPAAEADHAHEHKHPEPEHA